MKKRIYMGKNGLEVINSKRIMPNYVCDCPVDEDGQVVDDLDIIELEDVVEKSVVVGKKAIINKKKEAKKKAKKESDRKKVIDKELKVQQLREIDWDRAKISDIRKAIKLLLGLED